MVGAPFLWRPVHRQPEPTTETSSTEMSPDQKRTACAMGMPSTIEQSLQQNQDVDKSEHHPTDPAD
jgi:hypothetical protein